MKKVFKRALCSLIAIGSMAALSAIDFGGMITNDSKLSGNGFNKMLLEQKNAVSAWIRIPFNQKGTTYLAAEGMYQFQEKGIKLFGDAEGNARYTGLVDLSLLKFSTTMKKNFGQVSISAGRFFSSDLSGLAYAQTADSVLASIELSRFNLALYGAYTGLLNARTVSMINNTFALKDGKLEKANVFGAEDEEKHYQRAEDYIVGSAVVSFPYLFANQTVSAQFLGTFHVKDASYTRMYAELSIGGPLVSTLYYNVNTTFGFASYDGGSMDVSNLSKAVLSYYNVDAKNLAVNLGAIYASGDSGLKPFTGFTSQTATNALSGRTEYTGLLKASLLASIKPIQALLLGASGDLIFNAAESIKYEGFQYGANVNWQIVSDISLALSMYQYFDKDDSARDKSCVQLKAAISF